MLETQRTALPLLSARSPPDVDIAITLPPPPAAKEEEGRREGEENSAERAQREYSHIAEDYAASKQHPWRVEVEEHSLRKAVEGCLSRAGGGGAGKGEAKVLELACGAGHYSRKLVGEWGCAGAVVAVDLSPEMVQLARETTPKGLPIAYAVGNACDLSDFGGPFDLCLAAYLLNYASGREELLAMCRTIRANLRRGGAFVTVNDGPLQPVGTFASLSRYGFVKELYPGEGEGEGKPLRDFAPLHYRLFKDPLDPAKGHIEITNYRIYPETLQWAFQEAGFSSFRFLPLEASQNHEFFRDFIAWGPVCIMEAVA